MGFGGTGGAGQPGQIQSSDLQNAMFGAQASTKAMEDRYKQLGLGAVGAQPSGPTVGAVPGVPGSGTTPTIPGSFSAGGTTGGSSSPSTGTSTGTGGIISSLGGAPVTNTGTGISSLGGAPVSAVGGGSNTTSSTPSTTSSTSIGGPTAFQMDTGQLPSWTGGIPGQFSAALGEGQFQDLGTTTQAAVASEQAKGQLAQGIGGLIGGI